MLHPAPTTMSSSSARSTDPYQRLGNRPIGTAPQTTAPGATQASLSIEGTASPSEPIITDTLTCLNLLAPPEPAFPRRSHKPTPGRDHPRSLPRLTRDVMFWPDGGFSADESPQIWIIRCFGCADVPLGTESSHPPAVRSLRESGTARRPSAFC